jgi:hypothetical protein
MNRSNLELFKELNPEALQKKFLNSLCKNSKCAGADPSGLKKMGLYHCVEAAGAQSDEIKGVKIEHPTQALWGG